MTVPENKTYEKKEEKARTKVEDKKKAVNGIENESKSTSYKHTFSEIESQLVSRKLMAMQRQQRREKNVVLIVGGSAQG